MSIFRRVIGWLREEGMAGQYLRHYESARYTWVHRVDTSIFVPPDAEELADVSFWQAGMDWAKYPHRSAIIRIGQNVWKDTSFETFYTSARARGIALGGYWFFDGRATPNQQANVIIQAMQGKQFELELWIDWERNYGGANEGLPNVVTLMQLVEAAGVKCKAVGMYTGYYWFTGNSNASANASQYTYLKQRPLWLAWYASPSVVKVPVPWTDYTLWQWGTPVIDWGQPTAEIDANKSRYSKADFAVRYLGGEVPQPIPYGYSKLRRYDSDVHIVKLASFSRALVTNPGKLQTVSGAAGQHGAKYAVNGDGWVAGDYKPLSLAASNGNLYQPTQFDFRPYVNVSADNKVAVADVKGAVTPYNLISGTRYAVKAGVNPYAASTNPEHVTELHPRTAIGHTADNKIILIVIDGRSSTNRGVTLRELSQIAMEAGCHWAVEMDGGGSSAMWVGDRIVNVPSDTTERAVANHLLIFEGETQPMKYTAVSNNNMSLRADHSVYATKLSTITAGKAMHGDELWTATADGDLVKAGDKWLRVLDVEGAAVDGWVAIVHMGQVYCDLVEDVPEPPPPADGDIAIDMTLKADGTITGTWTDA